MLRFEHVSKAYGGIRAVDDVTLEIAAGSFVALVGASGSGKSTLLKTVNRLVEPDAGSVLVNSENILTQPVHLLRRRIGYVFQSVGLFPHMNCAANIGIGAKLAGDPLGIERIAALLDLVQLDASYGSRMPDELSGGQLQRIGVARALAGDPQLLLMDEPFGALDPITRDELGRQVRALHDRLGLTTVMVTHDMAEALLLGSRVLVMDAGQIVADETPEALLAGAGGEVARALVAVPRDQARQLAGLAANGLAK